MGLQETALTREVIDESRRLIGVYLRRERHHSQVARPAIFRWTKGIGDRNPLYLDEGYASNSRLGTLTAPPCWLYSVDNTLVAPKLPGLHAIYGGTDWEFYQRLRLGDTITTRARLIGVEEREGQFCGAMVLQTGEVSYFNQRAEPVARALSTVLRTPRQAAVERGKYLGWAKHPYSQAELFAVEDTYDGEEIRGAHPRYWEQVTEGEELKPIVRGPLTSEDVLQFVGATTPVRGFSRFMEYRRRHPDFAFQDPDTGMWDSWEASLIDDKVARLFGFPFAHDCGLDRISWIGNLLTNYMGDDGLLKKLSVKLLLPNLYGDATYCRGKVTHKSQQGEENLVECQVWCQNQRGWVTAQGAAVVALPSLKIA